MTGVGVRGGFVVDLSWRAGKVTEARLRSVGGRTTTVEFGDGVPARSASSPGVRHPEGLGR